ncbi:MAG: hypothetical protein COC19_07955, partial [SAR86 cluster bacterium]
MKLSAKFLSILIFLSLLLSGQSFAWDAATHRLISNLAISRLSEYQRIRLINILKQHPRFDEDFTAAMPRQVAQLNKQNQIPWLLGQAAIWPDLVRSLKGEMRDSYHRPNWHYIDGAWLRGAARIQGNVYLGIEPLADIEGRSANQVIDRINSVDNIVLALDYNSWLFSDTNSSVQEQAIALCWVMHLIADIHNPVHSGSLFSKVLFPFGDSGGNGIATRDGNLHSNWDRALSGLNTSFNIQDLTKEFKSLNLDSISPLDWTRWLANSRQLLLEHVYPQPLRKAILVAEQEHQALSEHDFSAIYTINRQHISRQRI